MPVVVKHELGRAEKPWALALAPPFPPVASRLLALAGGEEADSQEIAALIRAEPTFTAELLRVANSALFGFSRRVATVRHAVVLLGLDRVKAMAMFVALRTMMSAAPNAARWREVWIQCVAAAMVAERLAQLSRADSESAYTAGLLHHIGVLGLICAYPKAYSRLLGMTLRDADRLARERELFGVDHCDAGGELATHWNLPPEIAAVASGHHAEPASGQTDALNLVRIAWRMAEQLGFGAPGDEDWSYDRLAALLPEAERLPAEGLRASIESQLLFLPR